MKTKNSVPNILVAAILGAGGGGLVWLFMILMEDGLHLFWELLPEMLNLPYYPLILCTLGGIVVGICQKLYGAYPEVLEIVIEKFREKGSYGHKKVFAIFLCALLPIVFGGSIGPEAGLSGVIFALFTLVGENLKNAEDKAKKRDFYIVAAIAGVAVCYLLTSNLGGGMAFSRFDSSSFGNGELLLFVPLAAIGAIAGLFYIFSGKLTDMALKPIQNCPVLKAVLGGIALGVCGMFLPGTLFSGELQMGSLMTAWEDTPALELFFNGLMKLVIVNVCIKTGWRGGHIFPLIFSGVCIGYGAAALFGIDGVYATAVITATLCGVVMKQPILVGAVLLIFYPVTSIIYILIAAFAGSKLGAAKQS